MKFSWIWLSFVALVVVFLFTRWYGFVDGYELAGDLGRDMFVLDQWRESGKPPLLGPQNSVLPFNQSAVFFYTLMPLYWLTGWWPYANLLSLTLFILGVWVLCMWLVRKTPQLQVPTLAILLLSTLHPQYIDQTRYVWNPSFVAPLLTLGILSLLLLQREWKRSTVGISVLALAAAVSFSYSVAPLLLVLMAWVVWTWRNDWKKIAMYVFGLTLAGVFWNLPTLAFEVKYKFQLVRAVLAGPVIEMPSRDIPSKLQDSWLFLLSYPSWNAGQALVLGVLVIAVLSNLWLIWKSKIQNHDSAFLQFLSIWFGVLALTFISPTPMQAHYIFGITTVTFFLLALLRHRILWPTLVALGAVWVFGPGWAWHFEPTRLPVPEMMACAQQICDQQSEPVFVSVMSSAHPFHTGPEFRYALQHSGCAVEVIETHPQNATKMIVIEDGAKYQAGETEYYELSLFGPHREVERTSCSESFDAVVLEQGLPAE